MSKKWPNGPCPTSCKRAAIRTQRLDVAAAGHVRAGLPQAVVGRLDHAAGQVHRPQDVLKAGVLGRRVDPPGGLQLVDLAEPLDPGMIDDRLLRDLSLGQPLRRGERDISVDDIVAEAGVDKLVHAGIISSVGGGVQPETIHGAGPPSYGTLDQGLIRSHTWIVHILQVIVFLIN